MCIDKKANINFLDRKKWSSFLWASCNGHYDILKILIEKGGGQIYLEKQEENKKEI